MRALLLGWLLLGLTGCAGYRLGPSDGSAAGARSIQVNYFQNQTIEPRLVEAVNHSLRKTLQQDGTFRLETRGDGDLVVNGVITSFNRSAVSFQPADILTVRDYSLALTAHITVLERSTGRIVLDQAVSGATTIRTGNDLASAERQAVPLMAEDLARRAVDLIADGTW